MHTVTSSEVGIEIDTDIDTPEKLKNALQGLGYQAQSGESFVSCPIGGHKVPFLCTFTSPDEFCKELEITCILTTFGEIPESQRDGFAEACLLLNAEIQPYAVAVLAGEDDAEESIAGQWPVALVNTVVLGDFCIDELRSAMQTLEKALHSVAPVLRGVFS